MTRLTWYLGAVAYVADRVIRMVAGKAFELDPSRPDSEREEER